MNVRILVLLLDLVAALSEAEVHAISGPVHLRLVIAPSDREEDHRIGARV